MGVTWHFVDEHWNLNYIPIATLNISCLPKNTEQLCTIVQETVCTNFVVGTDVVVVTTVATDNEQATARAVDLFTNFGGSVCCVVHPLALVVNDVVKEGTAWQTYMDHINTVSSNFNYHPKANMLLKEKQLDAGVTQNRLQRLKRDVRTRWHSRLGAVNNYLSQIANISAVV